MEKTTLRPFRKTDMEIFVKWLNIPYVKKWYEHPQNWIDEIEDKNNEYGFVVHFIIEQDGVPVGFCQYYEYDKGGEDWHGTLPTDGAYSLDYLIGEEKYLRRGIAKNTVRILNGLIGKIDGAKSVIVQPEPENNASRNTLLSAGYTYDAENDVFVYRF